MLRFVFTSLYHQLLVFKWTHFIIYKNYLWMNGGIMFMLCFTGITLIMLIV